MKDSSLSSLGGGTLKAITKAVIDEFRKIDCANVADVYRKLDLNCGLQGLAPLRADWKICGPAMTMRQVPLQDKRDWDLQETSITVLIESADPGTIIVIDAGGRLDVSAGFGGNAAIMAVKQRIEGIVIDGACRDSAEIVESGPPTFVRGTTHPPSHGVYRATCINSEPIQLGSGATAISVAPGDLVLGDRDGIVVVPANLAEEILALARERQEVDKQTRQVLIAGDDPDGSQFSELRGRAQHLQGLSRSSWRAEPPARTA
jgi:regulator of RNase E activity RraA